MLREEKTVMLLLGIAHSMNHSLFLVLPPLLQNIAADLNMSFQTLGFIATIGFLIYGAGSLIGGPLSDVIGEMKVTRMGTALSGLSTVIFLFSRDPSLFAVGMFIMSFWASFYHPASNNLILKLFKKNTGSMMGIHGAAGSIGQMFTPTLSYILGVLIDWRFAFFFFGVISVLTALQMREIKFDREEPAGEKAGLFEIFKVHGLWIIYIYSIVGGLYGRGVELFFPTFLRISRGFTGELAAVSNSLVLLFGVVGQLLGGKAADRFGPYKVVIASALGVTSSLFILMFTPISEVGVTLFIIIYGIFIFSNQPAMSTLIGQVSPKHLTGVAYGITFFFAFGLGSVSTTIAGYLAEAFNLEIAFRCMFLFSILSLLVALTIPKFAKKET